MSIPEHCTVLVIGGGPAGSYAACCLAREGIDTVVLEAEKFPRYHIGESVLVSMRHFLKFIDLDDTFEKHGFYKKPGAAFKLSQNQPDSYTDFIKAGTYSWNVIRSESDDLIFKHAAASGAATFDETKVDAVQFKDKTDTMPGTPVSATWHRADGSKGSISFDYLIDCSGRQGILSTKYLKNRVVNQNLKNVANWAYWKTDGVYGKGTIKENAPYFECFADKSGWMWFIPLHNGTVSVGVVQDQKIAAESKRALNLSAEDYYKRCIKMAPYTWSELLYNGTMETKLKSASDWSYTASQYHLPNARICGDAGCFIDPLFSSGVHLAMTSGLSAVVTILASMKGTLTEEAAGSWHTKKVIDSYTRFFLTVTSATNQIRSQELPVGADMNEDTFQAAFDLLGPIIQGRFDTDVASRSFQSDVDNIVHFCFKAFNYVSPGEQQALLDKLRLLKMDVANLNPHNMKDLMTPDEISIIETMQGRKVIETDVFGEVFSLNIIDGYAPRFERGRLGLVKAETMKREVDVDRMFDADFLGNSNRGHDDRLLV